MERRTLPVDGMACGGCEDNVESALGGLEGVSRVEADSDADTVEVVADESVSEADVRTAVEEAGYEPV